MKHSKFSTIVAATVVILIGTQSFTQCRGDDSGTYMGVTFIADPGSPTSFPLGGDYTGTTTINTGRIILGSALDITRSEPLIIGPGTLTTNAIQAGTSSGSTLDVSGTGSLEKVGAGTLIFNGNNTYTGAATISCGGTLDLNNIPIYTKPIDVQGAGVGNNGAIVNNNTAVALANTQYDVSNVTLSDNTTIGGTSTTGTTNSGLPGNQFVGRWSLRAQSGSTATLNTNGHAYTLTKVGNNQIMLVGAPLDSALGRVCINQGVLSLEGTTTLSNPAGATIVNGDTLQLNSAILNASSGTLNIGNAIVYNSLPSNVMISGAVTLNYDGLTDVQTGALQLNNSVTLSGTTLAANVGILTKTGAGTVTLSGGVINVDTININSDSLVSNIVGSGTTTLINRYYALTGSPLTVGNLATDTGTDITIAALSGSPAPSALQTSGDTTEPVPEPSVMVLLSVAVLAFLRFGLRPNNSTVRP